MYYNVFGDYMNRRRKHQKKYLIVIIIIIIIIALSILHKTVNYNRNLTKIEGVIKDTGIFINKIVYSPVKFIKNKVVENKEKKEIYDKYNQLKSKLDNYDILEAQKRELDYHLREMKKVLNLNNTLNEDSYLNASVVNRNIGIWYNEITIDKGSKNGVKKDMPVIVKEGLIGKVVNVSNFNSTVKLLTSDSIIDKISVKIENKNKYIYGLLVNYDAKKRLFIIEGIDQNTDIETGSIVTTTGLGDYFPSGILVGKVKQVTTDNFDLSKIVEVETDVNFNQINYVTILKRKVGKQ